MKQQLLMIQENEIPDSNNGIGAPVAIFISAAASTVLELKEMMRHSDPIKAFLEQMQYHVVEMKTNQGLSTRERDFLDTLHFAFQVEVLNRK